MNPDTEPSSHFDAVAADYDRVFTYTPLGRRQREIVWLYLKRVVQNSQRALELNCGTGEDAIWLAERCAHVVATDISPGMLDVAREKARPFALEDRLEHRRLALQDLHRSTVRDALGRFDLIVSNFDGLNCLPNVEALPAALAGLLNPSGHLVVVYMNPVCVMEIAAEMARGRFVKAFQRMHRKGAIVHIGNGISIATWFHPIHRVTSAFSERFVLRHVQAIGLITPPTSMRSFYHRHERAFRRLHPLENRLASLRPFNHMGDHVLLHFQLR